MVTKVSCSSVDVYLLHIINWDRKGTLFANCSLSYTTQCFAFVFSCGKMLRTIVYNQVSSMRCVLGSYYCTKGEIKIWSNIICRHVSSLLDVRRIPIQEINTCAQFYQSQAAFGRHFYGNSICQNGAKYNSQGPIK